ncbi:phage tail length tape measure family protein [Pseudovibrio exalbescens]|uniref:phage tail length tape measure family protein n=1 Tax=Pseudovibrio exalbescens TaxID=197461 RepID=UPI0011AFAFA7|nr:phage tail length tape measure family protein [Pseudovibrio exalbescens]
MASGTEKLVMLYEAQNNDVLRKLRQIEKSQKKAFDNKNVSRFNRSMQASATKGARLKTAFAQAGRSVSAMQGPLGAISGRFSSMASSLTRVNPAVAAFGIGIAGLSVVSAKALKAFEGFETQSLKLDAVLKATGFSAGRTAQQLENLAQGVGYDTLAGTTGARDAITQLLTFRSITGETFDRTIQLSQDLAAVGFGTLESSAVQLGKALEDPANGLSALRRVGVSFSQSQRDLINNFVKTGQVAQAQNVILDAVESQVGGAGVAAGSGLAGAYDGLAEATQILLERWGRQIAEATNLRGGILGIADAINRVNEAAKPTASLPDLNEQIGAARERLELERRSAETTILPSWVDGVADAEAQLHKLERRRQEIWRKIDQDSIDAFHAKQKGIAAQQELANQRVEAVVAAQEKLISNAAKTPLQRQIDLNLSTAGVTADSDAGQRVIEVTRRAFELSKGETKARAAAASAAGNQADQVHQVIEALQLERQQIAMNDVERRISNELTSAGAGATALQRAEIEKLTRANAQLVYEQEQAAEMAGFMGQNIASQFQLITGQIETGNRALDTFIQNLANAAIQAAVFGEGPFGKFFGGSSSGGGGLMSFLGKFGGFFKDGGNLGAGRWGIAGEAGPELIRGPASVTPMRPMAGAGGLTVSVAPSRFFDVVVRDLAGNVVQHAAPSIVSAGAQAGAALVQKNFGRMQSQAHMASGA